MTTMTGRELFRKIRRRLGNYIGYVTGNYGSHASFSLEGEDMVLRALLQARDRGFYVDVGAHHPRRFSNTFYFYRNGWRGLNLDPLPGTADLFRKARPHDRSLEIGVGLARDDIVYYMFEDAAYNTFDERIKESRVSAGLRLKGTKRIQVFPLAEVLSQHLAVGQKIDFLSVDVEGFDLQVLQSNNWEKYRPDFVVVEILHVSLAQAIHHPVSQMLKSVGYEMCSKCFNSCIYRSASSCRGASE